MNTGLTVLRKQRTDWVISWPQNKVRWVLFYYLVGLILSCLITFFEEVFFPLEVPYLYKSLAITILIPGLTIGVSILAALRKGASPSRPGPGREGDEPGGLLERHEQPLLALLMFAIWAAGYFAVAQVTAGHAAHRLPTLRWEREITLLPEFVWIYLTIYPTFLLPFMFIRQKQFFRLFSFAYITVMCVCYLSYLLYPVSIQRPTLTGDSFSAWTLGIVYRVDRPWNCFPSMHVAMSLLAALTILEVHRVRGLLTLLLTVWIAYSTVLTRQHYVLDVVGALVLTLTIHFFYVRKRILDALFETILRAEETLEGWINRKIDNRVWEALEGPLRARVFELVESMVEESLRRTRKRQKEVSDPGRPGQGERPPQGEKA